MKAKGSIFLFFFVSSFALLAQNIENLSLPKPGLKTANLNVISFQLPTNALNNLHDAQGKKLSINASHIVINDDTFKTKHIRVRGKTSSYYRRKSFNISITKKAFFHSHAETFSTTKFYAVSMNMDRNYVRNAIAYAVLRNQQVATPLSCYSNLMINGKSEGLYLVFYPPDEYASKEVKSPLVIRRGYDGAIDKISSKDMARDELKVLRNKFHSLYKFPNSDLHGAPLHEALSQVLDLKSYFTWLAFNDLFQNGDYADEIYFMWNARESKYQIIPWDFDDILLTEPHEGASQRKEVLGDKLIFSSEDKLDVMIANDPYLYKSYLKYYLNFLEQFTAEEFSAILVNVWQQVSPFYLQEDIIAQSQFDKYGRTDITKLENDLNAIYQDIELKKLHLREEILVLLKE